MILIQNVTKSFEQFKALDNLDIHVNKGSIYGLVGTNGAGKTTIIKHLTGIIRQDAGQITVEGEAVFDNQKIKEKMGFIPDDLFFFSTYNLKEMSKFYKQLYPNWNEERYAHMVSQFKLDEQRKLARFSKGMQKQAAFILTMSTMPDYLILDEPIDGLDPIIRKLVWKYIVEDVAEKEMTVLVSSHNLRELEGICDSIGILSKGHMVMERDLDELKSDIHKIQVAYKERPENPYEGLNVLHQEARGTIDLLIIRNKKEDVEKVIEKNHPVVFDMLPLSLEEIFIYELGGVDSEIQGILF
ncbi:ABC transporter ATP-binding protein [Clostridium aminobutyricum]|uniref:ABC transporter ATP-binding protein n=1 Tax=Clostridium aminobutyricum TaxID=33953 RepID=A0A939D770_CLOAM|nr:ABC transporter ATP-binding protein [Clostridium aminobutyricum]MBN7772088.1 ABC transporter ATP-binding protein [Clostridium aminobutyricum]